jgi:phosphatidate cytidylyltransferase
VKAESVGRFPSLGSDLGLRTASAFILAVPVIVAAWVGGIVGGLLLALAAAIVQLELSRLSGDFSAWALGLTLAVAAAIVLAAAGQPAIGFALAGIALVAALASPRWLWRAIAVAYAAAFGLALISLRDAPEFGRAAVFLVLVVTWATDTGAYFVGRLAGGPKLWPEVSPNKTRSGALGGVAASVAAALVFAPVVVGVPLRLPFVAVAFLLSVACQAGDLFESYVKRHFGAKDASNLIPGHGGLMDRVDGLIFAAGVAAVIGVLHGGPSDLARGLVQW